MYINRLAQLQKYTWLTKHQNIELLLYSFAGFFLPFMLSHPQWLVGTIVNAMLISGAMTQKSYKLLPIIILPTFGVLAAGMLFGNFTIFLLYIMPFIWISNAVLVLSMKHFCIAKQKSYWTSLAYGAVFKSSFLFIAAFALVSLGTIPAIFLVSMGIIQLFTAMSGGVLAYGFEKIKRSIA